MTPLIGVVAPSWWGVVCVVAICSLYLRKVEDWTWLNSFLGSVLLCVGVAAFVAAGRLLIS